MIQSIQGNLLESQVDALVNAVNCVGVMGNGIALQFKNTFPENYDIYRAACRRGEVVLGKMFVTDLNREVPPRYIINFPTKQHWRQMSKLSYIEAGLTALIATVERLNIQSIAIPPLGCGLGGLDWNDVRPLIELVFTRGGMFYSAEMGKGSASVSAPCYRNSAGD